MHELIIVTEREKFIVPIYAIGKRALLDFPDMINFGSECPVKYNSEKSVILHNRGDKATKWELKLSQYFSASKTEGLIEENSTEQLLIRFYPLQNKHYEEIGQLLYDGDEAHFGLKGTAINGEVYLSRASIKIDETYITLESKQTFKIVNKSTVKIDFEWRAFSSEKEELDKKRILSDQINMEEAEKRKIISEMRDYEENMDEDLDGNDENSFEEPIEAERENLIKNRKKQEHLMERKYKTIRKALDENNFIFEDEIFSLQPLSGSIWPNSEMVITVIFKPKSALKYTHKAFCNVSCSDERLPLSIEGEGLGPKAFLSTNILSIGDIFVNDKQSFNLYIENKGEISADFSLMKNTTSTTNIITFDSEEGILAVGQRMNIILTFQSFRVGEFQEVFKWKLDGSSELLSLLVRGHVRSPRFEFDKKMIDFKKVSYQFEETQELVLTNTSLVMFIFSLRIPQDGKGSNREFEIVPATDSISPGEAKRILIKFMPHYRKVYNVVLVLDMEGIGKDMKTIPISAESEIPKVKMAVDTLDFGDIFLRYPQTKSFELINESKLFARFVINPINPKFNAFGKVTTDLDKGTIPPESVVTLNVGLTTSCLKNFQIDLVLEIISDTNEQHLVKIKGNSIGPIVELSHKEIDFGEKDVLQTHIKKITLTNKSIIEADFIAFTKSKNSIFKPIQRHHVLKAGQSFDVEVACIPDDNQKFFDTLFFVIKEGMDKEVKLKAKGVGTTIFCKDISTVDFGTMYTHRTKMEEVFIENKGRKPQTLKWTRKLEGKKEDKTSLGEDAFVFSVHPETMQLPPKTGLMFQFKAHSIEIGKIKEQFTLSAAVNSDRKTTPLFMSNFEAEFIRPHLIFNKKALTFQYIWESNTNASVLSQDLEITCGSPLATTFSFLVEAPFSVSPEQVSLLPGKKVTIRVDFDPTLKKDRISGELSDKIWIRHFKHPKNESFPLYAEFCYPNLSLSAEEINFGAVMNDTIKKYALTLKNTSRMALNYCWYFAEQPENESNVSLNEVFDILPLRGTIEPNGEENVEFLYFAMANKRFHVVAVCKVDGGPDYFVNVNAEAANVAYNLSIPKKNKVIDIGETFLGTKVIHDFEVENTSKVMFDYSIHMDLGYPKAKLMSDFISFQPAKGILSGGEKTRIKLIISPGFPGELSQCLVLQIAHFEPERILLKGFGLFPSLKLDAKRRIDPDLINLLQKMKLTDNLSIKQPVPEETHVSVLTSPSEGINEDFKNAFESLFQDMSNEKIVEIEQNVIKSFIKQNRSRIVNEDKKSMISNGGRSQTKLSSSTGQFGDQTQNKFRLLKNDLKLFEEIVLGSYLLNLGTIIAGNKASKTLRINNIGKSLVNFVVDLKGYKASGLSFSSTKINKLSHTGSNTVVNLTVSLQTKKTTKPGKQVFNVSVNVENGGKYILEIVAFVTVPELNISSENVNFGTVQIGLSKKIFLRLENTKEINCEWSAVSIVTNQRIGGKKKEELYVSRVSISPNHGIIVSRAKKIIELSFEPHEHRIHEEMIAFNFKDSTRKLEVICHGEGVLPNIEFLPNILTFSPCMPKTQVFRSFQIKNNSEFDICLVTGDKDVDLFEDERLLSELPVPSLKTNIRNINDPFWSDLKEEIEMNKVKKNIENQIAELEADKPENWCQTVADLQASLNEKMKKQNILSKIDFENRDNLIIWSHFVEIDKQLAEFLKEAQNKAIINLNELLDWNIERKTEIGTEAAEIWKDAKAEFEQREVERKKQKNRKNQENETLTPPRLTQEVFERLLLEKMSDSDCNVGCLIYNLENEFLDLYSTAEVVLRTLKNSKIINIEIHHPNEKEPKSEDDSDESSLVTIKPEETPATITPFINEHCAEFKITDEQRTAILASLDKNDSFERKQIGEEINVLRGTKNSPMTLLRIPFNENLTLLNYSILRQLPRPNFPDPNIGPLPSPVELQIVKKTNNFRKPKPFKHFQILTPIPEMEDQLDHEELTTANASTYLNEKTTRWVIEAHSSRYFYVQFTSETLGEFSDVFTFENLLTAFNGLQKPSNFTVKANTEYPSISKTLKNIFTNTRKNRAKSKKIINEFITSENLFEFGPLLLLTKSTKPIIQNRHSTIFRFTNHSNYPITLNLMFQSEIGNFSGCPALTTTPGVFEIDEREVVIKNETYEARIWCFPKTIGVFHDSLICAVKNNPMTYKINMRCEGIIPSISLSTSDIIFDRILVGKKALNSFDISNDSLIPVRWRIVNFQELAKLGFDLSHETGDLEMDEKINIEVSFMTQQQEKKNCQIIVEAEDTQGLGIHMKEKRIVNLTAEGFKVNVTFSGFKTADKTFLDFGSTLVDFPVENSLGIKNEGIYPVKYQVEVVKQANLQYFEITPGTGELLPNGMANVQVRFTAKKEVYFEEKQREACIQIKIFERNDVHNTVPVFVRANAQFSRAVIEPGKALSFGPVAFYESKTKTFEIMNNGHFEFAYELYEADNATAANDVKKRFEALKTEQLNARAKAKDKTIVIPKAPKGKTDKLGVQQFVISPNSGNLLPGQTQKFDVTFKGQGASLYEMHVGFEHTNRNPSDANIQYLLCAESCVPCLETQNFRVIFEEQVVTQSLTSTGINIQSVVNSNIFSIEDNAFYFGNIVPTQNPDGITERIKIINNGKVFANVKFDALKKGSSLFAYDVHPKSARINPHESVFVKLSFKPDIMAQYEGIFSAVVENGDSSFQNCKLQFDLKGEGTLPSLNVMPEALTQHSNDLCLDMGRVRLGKAKKGVICLKNIGIIPATFQCFCQPPSSLFRLLSSAERTLMPMEVYQFQIEFCPPHTGKAETRLTFSTMMNPYEKSSVLVKGECIDELCVLEDFEGEENTLDFGDIIANFQKAELDADKASKYEKKRFVIKNYSNEIMRVDINRPDDLAFLDIKPSKVHIPPRMGKKVVVALMNPVAESKIINKELSMKCQLISLKKRSSQIQKLVHWDSAKTNKRMITQTEQNWLQQLEEMKLKYQEERQKNPKAKEPVYPPCPPISGSAPLFCEYKEPVPEPEFDVLQNLANDYKVKVLARIDVPKVSIETNQVVFRATKMYSSRVYTFKATNSSNISIPFECEFFNSRTSSKDAGGFSVSPASGVLVKNSTSEFLLRFAPVEFETLAQRLLTIKIRNNHQELSVSVEGEVTRPVCHFELPYTISDKGEKLIEIETLGINTRVAKKFHVINPTLLGYEFAWLGDTSKSIGFKCVTPKGIILPGKKFEMVFEFAPETGTPEKQNIRLSFSIPQFGLTEHFVFRTKVMQPKIFLSTSKVDFGPLLLAGKSKEIVYIKNLDQSHYSFSFSKAGLKIPGAEHANSLKIFPLSGQLPPGQDTPITLTFSPKLEIDFNYNLQVSIPQKKEPLTLNIKGCGYKLHHEMRLGNLILDSKQKHLIDFGEIFVHDYLKKTIEVYNSGDFNIDFLLAKKPSGPMTIMPESGTVRKGEHAIIELAFQSAHNAVLKTDFQLQIVSGPSYDFTVNGSCKAPLVEISPKSVNFGEVILKKSGVSKTVYLEICNLDKKTLSLETDFTKNEYFELKMPFGQTIQPFEDKRENIVRLPLIFKPTIEGKFSNTFSFFVNGRHKIDISMKGEAISCLCELANSQDALTDFGISHVNSKQTRSVSIKNFSKLATAVRFDIDDQLFKLASLGLSISPTTLTLQKRATGTIDITYAPQSRQRQFYLPIKCFIQDTSEIQEMFTLSGTCFGPELKLVEESLCFGQVVVNSFLTKKAQLINSGDLSAEYTWELGVHSGYISVSPSKGIIAPNEQVTFQITFSPKNLNDYRFGLKLFIKGGDSPFSIAITGKGIATPTSSIEHVTFETNVRTKIVKTVNIKNTTASIWNLRPSITTDTLGMKDYYSCLKNFEVPPNGQCALNITYSPQTVLPEKQNALLFIPLSDGTALTYQLTGKALPPKPEDSVSLSFKAKTQFMHSLAISNWLIATQKFIVSYELAGGKTPLSEGILINSVSFIEVFPGNTQTFKMSLYALKKGNFILNVFLRNKENKECLQYPLNLTVEDPTVLKTFELFNFVRESKIQVIPIENPLHIPVTIQPECVIIEAKDLVLNMKAPFTIKPQSETFFEVIYRPLLTYKSQKALVKVNSLELGIFIYELSLNSEKSSNIPTINFKASLGTDHTRHYVLFNYLTKPAPYTCKIESLSDNDTVNTGPTDYTCESQTVNAPMATNSHGIEVPVNVRFEPSFIGVSKALLTISNPEGGEYQAFLVGSSSSPLPKGPFKVQTKGSTIDFKNTFYEAKEFFIRIDNPNFICSTKSPFKLEPKKSVALSLSFKGGENATGRIIIETKEQISWIYYLQGI